MKKSLSLVLFCLACANQVPPTGGMKDLDPPVLVQTTPENRSLQFHGKEITLEFDEYIKEENLKNQLMITPDIKGEYKYRVNKTKLILTFDQPFDSATTYTLNFRDGVKDITESNVPENLQFVFSTGTFLDSVFINGSVRSLLTNGPLEDVTISLYPDIDTVTIFNNTPMYSTKSDKTGQFKLENIKYGSYQIFALKDENRNLKLETQIEGYAFLEEPKLLSDSLTDLTFYIQRLDTRPIILQNSRPVGGNFDLKFNKNLISYQILDEDLSIYSNLVENNKTLRVYYNEKVTDSLALSITVEDSLQQKLDTTIYVKFEESSRKPEKLTTAFDLSNGPVNKQLHTKLKFNKPVSIINYDSIYFRFDSLRSVPLEPASITKNYSGDELVFGIDFNQILSGDSILLQWHQPFDLILSKGSLITVENDTVSKLQRTLTFKDPKDFGLIKGTINTTYQSFIVQLVDNAFKVTEEIKLGASGTSPFTYQFSQVKPGAYSIRVLIDENNNGKWELGNILLNQLPEKVALFFHPNVGSQVINLRANWEQAGIDLSF